MKPGRDEARYAIADAADRLALWRPLDGHRRLTRLGHYARATATINIVWIVLVALAAYVSATSAAGGAVFAATLLYNPSARSVMALLNWFPARLYGAVGDGTDETADIQAALDAGNTAGGGKVLLRANTTYRVSTLNLRAQVSIEGANHSSTLRSIAGPAAGSRMLVGGSSAVRFELRNFTLDANSEANVARGAEIQGNGVDKFMTIRGCRFMNFTSATGLNPHAGATAIYVWTSDSVNIEDSAFVDNQHSMFMDTPGADCRIVNNKVWSTLATNVTRSGILLRRTSTGPCGALVAHNTVENVRNDTSGTGVEGHAIDLIKVQNVRVIGNTTRDTYTSGIHVGGGSYGAKVIGNDVSEAGIRNGGGIYVEISLGSRSTLSTAPAARTVSGAVTIPATQSTTFSVVLDAAPGWVSQGVALVDGKLVWYTGITTATLTGVTTTTANLGATIANAGAAVGISGLDTCQIIGNTIRNCGKNGISISFSAGTICQGNDIHECGWEGIFSDSDSCTIEANNISNTCLVGKANTSTPNVAGQIRVTTGTHNRIMANRIWNSTTTNVASYGIAVGDSSHTITGNECTNNATAPIFENGGGATNLVRDNPGYVTASGGTATVANAGTIAHGLAKTPTRVSVNARVLGHIAGDSAVDATNITVLLSDAAGAAVTAAESVRWMASA